VGRALAAAIEARADAAMRNPHDMRAALDRAEHILTYLDGDSLIPSAFGYHEGSFRLHEGNAYTHLCDVKSALRAQDRALELCTQGDYHDWTMTRLDRAQCLIHDGEISIGLQYATETLASLDRSQRSAIISLRGKKLLEILPDGERKLAPARDYREVLMLDSGEDQRP
jgi:hypothetical protein